MDQTAQGQQYMQDPCSLAAEARMVKHQEGVSLHIKQPTMADPKGSMKSTFTFLLWLQESLDRQNGQGATFCRETKSKCSAALGL